MTSGDLSIDLSENMTEILSTALVQSNRMFFPRLSLIVFELGGMVILNPPPMAKVAETAARERVNGGGGADPYC